MGPEELLGRFGLVGGTFLLAAFSALVPLANTEVFLVGIAALVADAGLGPVVLAAALGQVAGKTPLYLAGRGLLRVPAGRYEAQVERYRERFGRAGWQVDAALFSSASWGLPPFLVGPYLAGYFDVSLPRFLLWSALGRCLRFAAVVAAPAALRGLIA